MRSSRGTGRVGFTLVELVLALGVAVGGVVVALALLGELVALAARASEARQLHGQEDLVRFELRRRIVTPGESTFVERLPPWRDGESAAAVVLIANPDSEGARRFPVELWRWRTGGADGDLVVARLRGVAGGELVFSTKVVAP